MAEKDGLEQILVIKLGALGDLIQALGPMAAIRRHHPHAHITLLTTKPFEGMVRASGYFDDIWLDERPSWHQPGKWMQLRQRLNEGRFARVYDLQNNDRTGLYFRLLSPKPEWVGIAKGASHRNVSATRTAGQAFDGHVETLALAGIKGVTIDRLDWLSGRTDFPGLTKPYILLVAGSAPAHPYKRWPAENYAAIGKKIIACGTLPVLIGTEAERDVTAEIARLCPGALDLTGQTNLPDIVSLAREAAGAIGNDTGPMHMIAPTGCPTLVLFSGRSLPHRHAPKGERLETIQKDEIKSLNTDEVWGKFLMISNRSYDISGKGK